MTLINFINQVIDNGIKAAQRDYKRPNQAVHLRGSLAGFEECRGKTTGELALLLRQAGIDRKAARDVQDPDYWYWRCREAEIEWVCNCTSAVLMNQGLPTIVPATARAVLTAAKIVGTENKPRKKSRYN